jgi:DNA-binding transcriptional MerR regulator/methylmalonyl-CoA mutase cobalamin-binding subunit
VIGKKRAVGWYQYLRRSLARKLTNQTTGRNGTFSASISANSSVTGAVRTAEQLSELNDSPNEMARENWIDALTCLDVCSNLRLSPMPSFRFVDPWQYIQQKLRQNAVHKTNCCSHKAISEAFMFTIGAAARQTGITAATLRKWESRYGFPIPVRTTGDQRAFHDSDLVALMDISRRMANGQRAGAAIQAVKLGLAREESDSLETATTHHPKVYQAIEQLLQNDLIPLEECLANHFTQHGAAVFAREIAIPMLNQIGKLWQRGLLPAYAEHIFSSILQKVALQSAASQVQSKNTGPRILLASPAAETHTLALVLLNAVLNEAGIQTVFLQGGLPASEIAAAAAAFKVQVVALSAGATCRPKLLTTELRNLRALLDASVDLWIGGAGTHKVSARMDGVTLMGSIDAAVPAFKSKFAYAPNLVGSKKDDKHG